MSRLMHSLHQSNTQAGTDEEDLRQGVEQALAGATGNESPVAAIQRRGFPGLTSYAVAIVSVELATGEAFELFLKDYGQSRLPKDGAAERREREMRVYEDLLEDQELGTARFYGACRDQPAGRFWLMLEFVEGELLRDCSFELWPAAAAWLGRLHGRFVGQRDRLRACRFLVRHDADFFILAVERALQAVSGLSDVLARRLAAVLEGYDPILAVLSRDPETLVHGSYRPQNVLVVRSSEPPRICPTDWELAAFGRSAYDLAFVCDGFRPPQLDALLDAYEREAEGSGVPVRNRDELRHEVDCFRLHKTINSLGHVRQWERPAKTAEKVVAAAEELAGTLT
jgi:aminoglycoside phosphotransferase (APT) family kinase protein